MRRMFFLLLVATLSMGALAADTSARRVSKPPCGFSIEVPSGWTMERTTNRAVPCWYELQSRRSKDSCGVLVRTLDAEFDAAAKEAGFDKTEDGWAIVETWNETIPADAISGKGWEGLEAEHVVRYMDPQKGAEPYKEIIAVIHAGQRSAILSGSECEQKRFDRIVSSFRFETPGRTPPAKH